MPATPQYRSPQLEKKLGCRLWVKHENHTPVGAFKVRGGLVYIDDLATRSNCQAVICATRGNHGLSIAFAAKRAGIHATVVVPHGNSREKNAATSALGARIIEYGHDFQEALEHAIALAHEKNVHFVPPFHPTLVRGVATAGLEFFRGSEPLDAVYAPIGLGSGICGLIAARDALGLRTEIIGVVAENAPAVALSLERGALTSAPANTIADGMACRTPNTEALALLQRHQPRIVRVSDAEIAAAMKTYFTDTHNIAEGAGAAALAAALNDPLRPRYRSVGVMLTGANVDLDVFQKAVDATVSLATVSST